MNESIDEKRARRMREKKANRLRNYHRNRGAVFDFDLVDASEAIRVLHKAAQERNATASEMARICGVGKSTALRLLKADPDAGLMIQRKINRAIMRLSGDDETRSLMRGSSVSTKKARQVVRSLYAQGWTADHLAYIIENNLGVSGNCVAEVTKRSRERITKQNNDRIVWLEDHIGERIGPSRQLRRKSLTIGRYPLKHYNIHGDLIKSTLTPSMRAFYDSV